MPHFCHYPGCDKQVPPKMLMCKPHWFSLPAYLRAKVWAAYSPGQEIRRDPSKEYLAVIDEVMSWIKQKNNR